jgi:hypothetical protein
VLSVSIDEGYPQALNALRSAVRSLSSAIFIARFRDEVRFLRYALFAALYALPRFVSCPDQ